MCIRKWCLVYTPCSRGVSVVVGGGSGVTNVNGTIGNITINWYNLLYYYYYYFYFKVNNPNLIQSCL